VADRPDRVTPPDWKAGSCCSDEAGLTVAERYPGVLDSELQQQVAVTVSVDIADLGRPTCGGSGRAEAHGVGIDTGRVEG
jgi:hypothetical protein